MQLSSGAVAQRLGLSCSDSGHGAFALSQSAVRFRLSVSRFDYVWSDKVRKWLTTMQDHAWETIQNMHPVCFSSSAFFFLNHPWNIIKSMKSTKSNVAIINLAERLAPGLHSILPFETRIQLAAEWNMSYGAACLFGLLNNRGSDCSKFGSIMEYPKKLTAGEGYQVRVANWFLTSPQAPRTGWTPADVVSAIVSCPYAKGLIAAKWYPCRSKGFFAVRQEYTEYTSSQILQLWIWDLNFVRLWRSVWRIQRCYQVGSLAFLDMNLTIDNPSPIKNKKNGEIVLSKFWKCTQLDVVIPLESPLLKFLDLIRLEIATRRVIQVDGWPCKS